MIKTHIRHKVSQGEIHNLSDKESEILISTEQIQLEDPIWVITPNGTYLGKIAHISKSSVEVSIEQLINTDYITSEGHGIIQSILKPKNMKVAIRQAVGGGFSEIIPIQPHYKETNVRSRQRDIFQQIANESIEQTLTKKDAMIYDVTSVEELDLKQFNQHIKICLTIENVNKQNLSEVLKKADGKRDSKYLIAVGPPKGWHSGELRRFESFGFHMVSLGDTILRSESAGLATISAINLYQGKL